jgi:hypothetical protein
VDRRHRKTPSQLTKLSNAPEGPSIPDLNNTLCGGPPGLLLMLQGFSVRLAPHTQGAIASGRANASIAIFQAPFSRLSILNQWPSMVLSLTVTE